MFNLLIFLEINSILRADIILRNRDYANGSTHANRYQFTS